MQLQTSRYSLLVSTMLRYICRSSSFEESLPVSPFHETGKASSSLFNGVFERCHSHQSDQRCDVFETIGCKKTCIVEKGCVLEVNKIPYTQSLNSFGKQSEAFCYIIEQSSCLICKFLSATSKQTSFSPSVLHIEVKGQLTKHNLRA